MRTHVDARRLFVGDIFDTRDGDVNLVRLYPKAVCAWHRHQLQTDHLFCVTGAVRVGTLDDKGAPVWDVLDERKPGPLTIPAGTWHGYGAITEPCVILQYNTPKYGDGSDEERKGIKGGPSWVDP